MSEEILVPSVLTLIDPPLHKIRHESCVTFCFPPQNGVDLMPNVVDTTPNGMDMPYFLRYRLYSNMVASCDTK